MTCATVALVCLVLAVSTAVCAFPFVTYNQMLPSSANEVTLVQTCESGGLLEPQSPIPFTSEAANDSLAQLFIDSSTLFQSVLGFGGAITDSVAHVFAHLDSASQQQVLQLYYTPEGLNYTLTRLTIGSTDFSVGSYSYDDTPGDYNMSHFSIAHDEALIIPLVRRMLDMAGPAMRVYACPWSPPAWMKVNNDMRNSKMPGLIQTPEIFAAYALYLSNYVTAYEAAGVPLFALSVQNEPHVANQFLVTYECCGYNGTNEAAFLGNYLGPRLAADHPGLRIIIHDDQKLELVEFVSAVMADPQAAQYVWGVGVHWYTPFMAGYDAIEQVSQTYANLTVFMTEGTLEARWKQLDHEWQQGMYYSRDIASDLAAGAAGFTDWNIMLYTDGGPQHALGPCDAPILVDETRTDSYELQPGYYNIGHFSKFVPVDARRIGSLFVPAAPDGLQSVAFLSPDGATVIVVLVNAASEDASLQLVDQASGRRATVRVPQQGVQTLFFSAASGW